MLESNYAPSIFKFLAFIFKIILKFILIALTISISSLISKNQEVKIMLIEKFEKIYILPICSELVFIKQKIKNSWRHLKRILNKKIIL